LNFSKTRRLSRAASFFAISSKEADPPGKIRDESSAKRRKAPFENVDFRNV